MITGVRLLPFLWVASALATRIAILHDSPCDVNAFAGLACTAASAAIERYPNDDIRALLIDKAECASFAARNASQHGVMIMLGFGYDDCAVVTAQANPNIWVVQIDSCPPQAESLPNFICALFQEDQPAYIAGYLAGLVSRSKVTGVIGGAPVPAVQRLFNGYLMGVRASCPECRVEGAYINSFFHPANAMSVTDYLVTKLGVDVLFGCGGGTGSVAIKHATTLGAMVVGVDVDEYTSTFKDAPDSQKALLLTSALKQVDVSIAVVISLLKPLAVGEPIPALSGSTLQMDYANRGVGTADCHLSCETIGQESWGKMLAKENELASHIGKVGLSGFGWSVPLRPQTAQPNVLYTAPNPAKPPAPRIQASVSTFNAWLLDFVAVFGGRDAAGTVLNDLWLYNKQSGKWLDGSHGMTLGSPPPGLAKSCAVSLDLSMVIFGGRNAAGERSAGVYSYTYQPSFLGLGDSTNPGVRHEWATLSSEGAAPMAVEGPACVSANSSCAFVFGGRSQLADVSSLHLFCLQGTAVRWTEVRGTGSQAPGKREMAGMASVNASALGLGSSGSALVVAGGLTEGEAMRDVWLLLDPLGTSPSWIRLPVDLPQGLTNPLVFAATAPTGPSGATAVLTVQPSSTMPGTGFDTFTYDVVLRTWNTQTTSFGDAKRGQTMQASMVHGAGHMWLFGGVAAGEFRSDLAVSKFQVQTVCKPGEQSVGAGCEPCAPGNFSLGGVAVACSRCAAGTFASAPGTAQCAECPGGRYGGATGQAACPLCPRGRYKGVGSQPCESCPYGSYGPEEGADSPGACILCAAGKYTGTQGNSLLTDCQECEPGRFLSTSFGKKECGLCPQGTYAAKGAAHCMRCAKGDFQPSEGQDRCLSCQTVLRGSTTAFLAATQADQCICPEGMYRDGNLSCTFCPVGMECPLGSDMRNYDKFRKGRDGDPAPGPYPVLQPQYWSDPEDPLSVFLCQNGKICPGGNPGTCANVHTIGRSCAVCAYPYFATASGCQRCQHIETTTLLFPIIPTLLCPFVICVMYFMFRDMPEKWGSWQNSLTAIVFIMLNHYQMIALLQSVNVVLPVSVAEVFQFWAKSEDAISLFSIECAGYSGFQKSFLVRSLTPLGLFVLCVLTYFGTHAFDRLFGRPVAMDADRLVNVFLSIVYAFFTGIASLSLTLFKCQRNPNGKSTLMRDRSIVCFEEEWNSVLGLAIGSVLVYCVGCFVLFGYAIFVAPRHFSDERFQKRWKFLFIKYRMDVHWWGLTILVKGVFLNIGTVAFTAAGVQLYWMFVTQIIYVGLTVAFNPWRYPLAKLMDVFVHLAAMTAVSATSWFTESDDDIRRGMGTFVIAVTCVPFISGCVAALYTALPALDFGRGMPDHRKRFVVANVLDVCRDISKLDPDSMLLLFDSIGAYDQALLTGAMKAICAEMNPGGKKSRLVTGRASSTISATLSASATRSGGSSEQSRSKWATGAPWMSSRELDFEDLCSEESPPNSDLPGGDLDFCVNLPEVGPPAAVKTLAPRVSSKSSTGTRSTTLTQGGSMSSLPGGSMSSLPLPGGSTSSLPPTRPEPVPTPTHPPNERPKPARQRSSLKGSRASSPGAPLGPPKSVRLSNLESSTCDLPLRGTIV